MILPFEGRPNTDAMAFGEDLNPALGTQGNIYAKTVGNQLVVEFYQVQHWASGFPETFEIILDTATDQVTYQYNTLSWPDLHHRWPGKRHGHRRPAVLLCQLGQPGCRPRGAVHTRHRHQRQLGLRSRLDDHRLG